MTGYPSRGNSSGIYFYGRKWQTPSIANDEQEADMAIKRVGNVRLPGNESNVWSVAAPNHILPGDVMSGAPAYGGQSMREAPGPIITESEMVAVEPKEARTRAKKPKPSPSPKKRKAPRVRPVLPPDAKRFVVLPSKEEANRTAINLRIPTKLLHHYKTGGKGYQTRMIAVLELFVEEGGEFIEV
jgi:uncharacterized protein (DUF4415 family)